MLMAASVVGTLPTWILVGFALFVAFRVSKGGGGSAVSELSKANEVLTRRTHELGAEVRDLKIENERLKARTDFAQALTPVLESIAQGTNASEARQVAIMDAQASHEDRAQERHARTLGVLDLIAKRLGKEEL